MHSHTAPEKLGVCMYLEEQKEPHSVCTKLLYHVLRSVYHMTVKSILDHVM